MTINRTPPVNWQAGSGGGTDITAARLNLAQTGILDRVDDAFGMYPTSSDVAQGLATKASRAAPGRRPIATVGLLGASTEFNNGSAYPLAGPFPNNAAANDYGYWTFAAYRLGWSAPRLIRQDGVSGNTSAQILARVPAILAATPLVDAMICGSGLAGNDGNTLTVEQSIANMIAILDAIRGAGIIVIIQTAQPHGPTARGGYSSTADYRDRQSRLNDFLRRYAVANGCLLNDVERLTTDALTGDWKTGGYTADDLHPYKLGSKVIGYALADLIAPYVHAGDTGPCNALDPYNVLGTKGFMAGTLGANTPTSWLIADNKASYGETRVATWTTLLEARDDGLGNRFRVTLTAPGAVVIYTFAPSSFEGQAFDGALEIDSNGTWDSANVYDVGLLMQPFQVAQYTTCLTQQSHAAADFGATPKRKMPDLGRGVLKAPPIQRNASAAGSANTLFALWFWGETGASVSLSRGRARQVTT